MASVPSSSESQSSSRRTIQLQRMGAIQQPVARGATTLTKMATLQPMAATQSASVASQPPKQPSPSVFKKSATILYSTGRSVSIATASLEPQYPWDYDLDNDLDDDGLDDYDDEDEDLAGERYMINGEEEEYQHPSLETSKPIFPISLCKGCMYV